MFRQVPLPAAPVTMVELSTKVSKTLNKTTPGIQIWRIEVGKGAQTGHPSPGHPSPGCLEGLREGGSHPPSCPQCLGLQLSVQHPGLKPRPGFGAGAVGCAGLGWAVGVPPPGLMSPFLLQSMEMVPVPTKSYGNFYEGDCYVLLSVGQPGGPRGTRDGLCP